MRKKMFLRSALLISSLTLSVAGTVYAAAIEKAPKQTPVQLGYALSGIQYKAVCQIRAESENILVARDDGYAKYSYLLTQINDSKSNTGLVKEGDNTLVIRFRLNPAFDSNVTSYLTKFRDGELSIENCVLDIDL